MNILLADDSREVRSALRLVLEQRSGCRVIGEAADALHLLALCARTCPDAVILDAELSGLDCLRRSASLIDLLTTLRHICPRARRIALSSYQISGKEPWAGEVEACFCKSDPPDALFELLARCRCSSGANGAL